uniref:Protein Flattop n=1 Tax=Cairina moschata TaxID=8855 RepID=A0A8C3CMQ7_CAIMO
MGWEVGSSPPKPPALSPQRPTPRDGSTQILVNDRGHLLPSVPRSQASPWGSFLGTWDMPPRIPPAKLNLTARSAPAAARLTACLRASATLTSACNGLRAEVTGKVGAPRYGGAWSPGDTPAAAPQNPLLLPSAPLTPLRHPKSLPKSLGRTKGPPRSPRGAAGGPAGVPGVLSPLPNHRWRGPTVTPRCRCAVSPASWMSVRSRTRPQSHRRRARPPARTSRGRGARPGSGAPPNPAWGVSGVSLHPKPQPRSLRVRPRRRGRDRDRRTGGFELLGPNPAAPVSPAEIQKAPGGGQESASESTERGRCRAVVF